MQESRERLWTGEQGASAWLWGDSQGPVGLISSNCVRRVVGSHRCISGAGNQAFICFYLFIFFFQYFYFFFFSFCTGD